MTPRLLSIIKETLILMFLTEVSQIKWKCWIYTYLTNWYRKLLSISPGPVLFRRPFYNQFHNILRLFDVSPIWGEGGWGMGGGGRGTGLWPIREHHERQEYRMKKDFLLSFWLSYFYMKFYRWNFLAWVISLHEEWSYRKALHLDKTNKENKLNYLSLFRFIFK